MSKKRPFFTATIFIVAVVLISAGLGYAFLQVWQAHVQAVLEARGASGEERLLVTSIVASGATVAVAIVAALAAMLDRSRVLNADRRKKSIELHTEAAFAMWKAALASYRLLQKGEVGTFQPKDQKKLTTQFEEAEKATLLMDDEVAQTFNQLWTEAERIAAALLAVKFPATQQQTWTASISPFSTLQSELKAALHRCID